MSTHKITLMCCGKKKCPQLIVNDDKSIVLLNDDDPTNVQTIPLDPDQARLLRDQLNEKL